MRKPSSREQFFKKVPRVLYLVCCHVGIQGVLTNKLNGQHWTFRLKVVERWMSLSFGVVDFTRSDLNSKSFTSVSLSSLFLENNVVNLENKTASHFTSENGFIWEQQRIAKAGKQAGRQHKGEDCSFIEERWGVGREEEPSSCWVSQVVSACKVHLSLLGLQWGRSGEVRATPAGLQTPS